MLDFLFSISPEALLSASLGLATILLAVWVKMYIHGRKELSLRANDLSELLKNYQEEAKNLSVYIEKRLKNIDSTYRVSPDSRKQIAEKIKVLATQFNGGLRKPIQKFIAKYEC